MLFVIYRRSLSGFLVQEWPARVREATKTGHYSLFTGNAQKDLFCPLTTRYQKDFIASTSLSNDGLTQEISGLLAT
jgi:hypothetical protein